MQLKVVASEASVLSTLNSQLTGYSGLRETTAESRAQSR